MASDSETAIDERITRNRRHICVMGNSFVDSLTLNLFSQLVRSTEGVP